MANFSAIVPVAQMQSANDALEALGYGPDNFSVPCYAGISATHGALHCWNDPAFQADVTAQAGVIVNTVSSTPKDKTIAVATTVGAQWGANAPSLPVTGNAVANTLYSYQGKTWWCIQTFSRSTYGGDPSQYPALIRYSRNPNVTENWVQPIDQYDSYNLNNPFTGTADKCYYGGKTWRTLINTNVFTPVEGGQWTAET